MIYGKRYFDNVFKKTGAWNYSGSQFEKVKYARQLEILKGLCPRVSSILEIGCAEGLYTAMMAEAFPEAQLTCIDISHLAIERARQNLAGFDNVEFLEADIVQVLRNKRLPGKHFDIVVQSESLYYLFPALLIKGNLVSYFSNMASILKDEGVFLTCNGISMATGVIMRAYYSILGRFGRAIYTAGYREWNDYRSRFTRYDIKVFRFKCHGR